MNFSKDYLASYYFAHIMVVHMIHMKLLQTCNNFLVQHDKINPRLATCVILLDITSI